MRLRFIACSLVTIALCAGHAQERHPAPQQIRVRVRLVPVDVVVSDKKGKPVVDLKKGDFTVLENGRPQQIRHFEIRCLKPDVPDTTAPVARKISSAELVPQPARTFLILLGRGMRGSFGSLDSVIRFVRKDLLPQDQVAVFAYNRATDFTTDHEQVAEALERYRRIHARIDSALQFRVQSGWAALMGKLAETTQADIDSVFGGPAAVRLRRITPARVSDTGSIDDGSDVRNALLRSLEEDMRADLPFDDYVPQTADMAAEFLPWKRT